MKRSFVEAALVEKRLVATDTFVLGYEVDLHEAVRPGQFAMVHPGNDHSYVLPRPLSILDDREHRLDFLVKIAGRGSRELTDMEVGGSARIFAPLGNGFDLDQLAGFEQVVLVAGGVGLVPLHMLARHLRAVGNQEVVAIFGGRTPADLPMSLLGDEPAGPWQLWVESQANDGLCEGLVTAGLTEALDRMPDAAVVTCGPTPMMHAVGRICRDRKNTCQVCLEEQMGCGAGVCRACVVDDAHEQRRRTVCVEGPVFDLDAIRFLPEDQALDSAGCVQ